MNDLNMFNAVTAIAHTIGFLRNLITIQSPAHCAIADRMHTDLQFVFINARGNFVELPGGEQRRARVSRMARVIIQH